jgi:hypothetical protein
MFTRSELETAHFSVRVAQAVTRPEHPFRPTLDELLRRIESELTTSASGPEPVAVHHNWISTKEAAARMGCSTRNIRRIAKQLGGVKEGRDWMIPEDAA